MRRNRSGNAIVGSIQQREAQSIRATLPWCDAEVEVGDDLVERARVGSLEGNAVMADRKSSEGQTQHFAFTAGPTVDHGRRGCRWWEMNAYGIRRTRARNVEILEGAARSGGGKRGKRCSTRCGARVRGAVAKYGWAEDQEQKAQR